MANRRPLDQAIDAALGELDHEVRRLSIGDVLVAREHRRAEPEAWTCACRACRACRAVLAARKRWQELADDR